MRVLSNAGLTPASRLGEQRHCRRPCADRYLWRRQRPIRPRAWCCQRPMRPRVRCRRAHPPLQTRRCSVCPTPLKEPSPHAGGTLRFSTHRSNKKLRPDRNRYFYGIQLSPSGAPPVGDKGARGCALGNPSAAVEVRGASERRRPSRPSAAVLRPVLGPLALVVGVVFGGCPRFFEDARRLGLDRVFG